MDAAKPEAKVMHSIGNRKYASPVFRKERERETESSGRDLRVSE